MNNYNGRNDLISNHLGNEYKTNEVSIEYIAGFQSVEAYLPGNELRYREDHIERGMCHLYGELKNWAGHCSVKSS